MCVKEDVGGKKENNLLTKEFASKTYSIIEEVSRVSMFLSIALHKRRDLTIAGSHCHITTQKKYC